MTPYFAGLVERIGPAKLRFSTLPTAPSEPPKLSKMPNFVGPLPKIGFGIGTRWYKADAGQIDRALVDAIKQAVATGYRHLDAAEGYGNEEELGVALKEIDLPREEFFITTKVLSNIKDPEKALKTSLKKLQIDYVDLYLIHGPFKVDLEKAWPEMEALKEQGLVKNIGLSNFRIVDIERILKIAKHKPVVNQIEYHPYLQQPKLHAYLEKNDILLSAYAPLVPLTTKADGPLSPVVEKIAKKEGKTPAQVLLKWSLQKNALPVTTSGNPQRQKEQLNFNTPPWKLSDEEMDEIDSAGAELTFRKFWTQVNNPEWDN